jgi:predicted ATPase/DNA-binding XRE family transcriptional regulator
MAGPQPPPFAALLHRRRAGLTQQELADTAGISLRTVSDLERGVKQAPRSDTVDRLAKALQLDIQERLAFIGAARRRAPSRLDSTSVLASGPASLPPLVGRARELALIGRYLAGEGPPLLLVVGEPGIGKSRLLGEAAARAQAAGWQALSGGCARRSGQEPYEPFVSTLASAIAATPPARQRLHLAGCGWLARLLPELVEARTISAPATTLQPEQERRLMFAAARRYLANTAGPAGTLLVLDDLQWAGADALDLLANLVRAAGRSRWRGADPLALLAADLAQHELATIMRLSPLTRDSAAELLDRMLADAPGEHPHGPGTELPPDVREEILQRTEGVPFFLVSAVRALAVEGLAVEGLAVEGEEGAAEREWQAPWTVGQSIRARLSLLPEAARELLGAASVVGRVFLPAVVAAMLGWAEEEEMVGALEAACAGGCSPIEERRTSLPTISSAR